MLLLVSVYPTLLFHLITVPLSSFCVSLFLFHCVSHLLSLPLFSCKERSYSAAYRTASNNNNNNVCLCSSGQRGAVALKLGVMYSEHMFAVALTGSAREVYTHPLASYFLVRSSTDLRLLSGEHRCSFLDYAEDICLVALSDPPQTLNPNTLPLPLIPYLFRFDALYIK